jgi:NADP-dependent 3-hydroxy acid dehydrogenase YdfG
MERNDLRVLVTGATAGIGRVTAASRIRLASSQLTGVACAQLGFGC